MENLRTIAEIDADIARIQDELSTVRGTETEVYARIVGYYRSVRNWNKGKRDEYNHRKQFVCENDSCALHYGTTVHNESGAYGTTPPTKDETAHGVHTSAAVHSRSGVSYEFFGRKTCPNCPPVKAYLENAPIEGSYIDVDTEEGLKHAAHRGVMAAPTVIVFDKSGAEVARAHNLTELTAVFAPAAEHVA